MKRTSDTLFARFVCGWQCVELVDPSQILHIKTTNALVYRFPCIVKSD